MSEYTRGGFPLMKQSNPQRYLTYNEAMWSIDILQAGVLDRDLTAPPVSPAEGDAYIVNGTATGAWAGKEDQIAFYFGGIWNFLQPELAQGDGIFVQDEGVQLRWTPFGSPPSYVEVVVGDVDGPVASTNNAIVLFDGTTGKQLKDSAVTISTDGTMAANSDAKVATEKAVRTYLSAYLASQDVLVFKGVIDASTNPNYPAADAGHVYKISVAGKIGGGSGPNVQVGDTLYCITDSSAAGTEASVGANWVIVQVNIDGAVTGPASATDSHFVQFDGTTGKLIKGGIALDTDTALAANSDTRVPSQKAVKAYVTAAVSSGGVVSSVNAMTGAVSLNGGYIGVKGADIASAGTTDLATATGDWVDVTGTTGITALGTMTAGIERLVRFTGILTLTHNGTSLILPTAANITTAAGDFARFRSLGSGSWICVAYQRASGAALSGAGIGGSTGSTDNALLRADGTGGSTAQSTGILVTDLDEMSGYKAHINTQTGTSYTLVAADSGKIVELTNASAIALTADPALVKGFNCTIVQGGAGQVTVASTGSGTVVNRQSHTKTAGLNAMCALYVRSNSGSNAVFVFGGDTTT